MVPAAIDRHALDFDKSRRVQMQTEQALFRPHRPEGADAARCNAQGDGLQATSTGSVCTLPYIRRWSSCSGTLIDLCSAEMPSGRRDTQLQRFSVFWHPFSGPCSSYGSAGVDQNEYSWCNPPSTDFARTSAPGVHRHRGSAFEVRADPAGGPGTPGPSALCGRPPL